MWAGEFNEWGTTHDNVFRYSMSLMSDIQLCANYGAKYRNDVILSSCGKKPNSFIVGNPYLDDMVVSDIETPQKPYDLVLINPISRCALKTAADVVMVEKVAKKHRVWIEPNGDNFSDGIPYNTENMPRPDYLKFLKNCDRFITNSSSAYSEARYFDTETVWIGDRNSVRDSQYEDMGVKGFTKNTMEILRKL